MLSACSKLFLFRNRLYSTKGSKSVRPSSISVRNQTTTAFKLLSSFALCLTEHRCAAQPTRASCFRNFCFSASPGLIYVNSCTVLAAYLDIICSCSGTLGVEDSGSLEVIQTTRKRKHHFEVSLASTPASPLSLCLFAMVTVMEHPSESYF